MADWTMPGHVRDEKGGASDYIFDPIEQPDIFTSPFLKKRGSRERQSGEIAADDA